MKLTDISVIRELLGEEQTSFKKKYGQNFLINENVVNSIAFSCMPPDIPGERVGVVEIGPGIGVLTQKLCERAGKVVAIEIDRTLIPILEKTLAEFDNCKVINEDVMKVDLSALIREYFAGCERVVIAANLPYYITTPIIMMLFESRAPFDSVTVMVQKEVADRLCAPPGSDVYGAVTASVSYFAAAKKLFTVSAGNFLPAPKVDSAVVKFNLHKAPPVAVKDEKTFFRVIKGAFAQRRKTLPNSLSSEFAHIPRGRLTEIIEASGTDPRVRGESLGIADFARISDLIFLEGKRED